MSMDPEERERQIREWSEELEKVCSGWMDRVGFGISRHWFRVDGQGGVWDLQALVPGGWTGWGLTSAGIGSRWMDRVGFDICRHWFQVDGQSGV